MCLPLSGTWKVFELSPSYGMDGFGPQGSGFGLMVGTLWYASCVISAGFACPVQKTFHIGLVTGIVFPNDHVKEFGGSSHLEDWTITAWNYKDLRDDVFAEVVSKALSRLAINYNFVVDRMSSELRDNSPLE